jgi:hypothetical protein
MARMTSVGVGGDFLALYYSLPFSRPEIRTSQRLTAAFTEVIEEQTGTIQIR